MKKNEVKIKGNMTAKDVAVLLEDLVKSIKAGTVCIESGDNFVTLKPGDNIDFGIEAVQKKGKEKLSIEFGWRQPVPEDEEPENVLKISSKEPKIETPPEPVKPVSGKPNTSIS